MEPLTTASAIGGLGGFSSNPTSGNVGPTTFGSPTFNMGSSIKWWQYGLMVIAGVIVWKVVNKK